MNIEFLAKIKKLADNGIGGEKANATALLQKLIKKHNISPEELELDTKIDEYAFKFAGRLEKTIVCQCVVMVIENARGRYGRSKLLVKCTKLQYVEVSALAEFYIRALHKDLDTFMNAFIHKNNLFPSDSNPVKKEYTAAELEELEKMLEMMKGMEAHGYYKKLSQPKN